MKTVKNFMKNNKLDVSTIYLAQTEKLSPQKFANKLVSMTGLFYKALI